MKRKTIVTMSGNIGVGKSTLGCLLAKHLQASWLSETAFSSLFQHLIADVNVHSRLIAQMAFSTMRIATLYSALFNEQSDIIVVERNLRDSRVFHKVWREQFGFAPYDAFFEDFYSMLKPVNVPRYKEHVVWLTCPVSVLRKRIEQRDLVAESAHTDCVLLKLNNEYKKLYSNHENENYSLCRFDTRKMKLNKSDIDIFLSTVAAHISSSSGSQYE